MAMNGCYNSSQCSWSNAWPFSVFPLAKNFCTISLKSVRLIVLRSTVIFHFLHFFSNFFIPYSVVSLVFFTWAFCSISSSCSLFKSKFWLEKNWNFGTLKSPNTHSFTTELQSEQVQTQPQNFAPTLALKWYPQDLICQANFLTSLPPIRIRAANAFSACAFSVCPAKWCVLLKAVCHLASRIDNNK